jgi:hypothetical protein
LRAALRADLAGRLRREDGRLFDEAQVDLFRRLVLRDAALRALALRAGRLRVDVRVVLRVALVALDLRAAVRRVDLPDLALLDRLRLVITESPCVGWVNGFLLTIFGRPKRTLTPTGAILCAGFQAPETAGPG